MAYFETDPETLGWFDGALTHRSPSIRIGALELLSTVKCSQRSAWIFRAQRDSVARVAATAVLLEVSTRACETDVLDLFESDFAEGLESRGIAWEWEYRLVVAHEESVHKGAHLVWTALEDDGLAKRLAVLKAYAGKEVQMALATPIIIDKRLVNQFTRAPRSTAEAMIWHRQGRPKYAE